MTHLFTSDTHFNHAKVIEYSKRPFSSLEEMNETLILRWNKRTKPKDIVWFLGDFALGNPKDAIPIISRLNGIKHLIKGNHNRVETSKELAPFWSSVHDIAEININGRNIVMCHYAMRTWNKSHYGSWHLYGHSHGNLPEDSNACSIDVGVDCHDFYPLSFSEIETIMSKKSALQKPLDRL